MIINQQCENRRPSIYLIIWRLKMKKILLFNDKKTTAKINRIKKKRKIVEKKIIDVMFDSKMLSSLSFSEHLRKREKNFIFKKYISINITKKKKSNQISFNLLMLYSILVTQYHS